jgi:hypothetical protein
MKDLMTDLLHEDNLLWGSSLLMSQIYIYNRQYNLMHKVFFYCVCTDHVFFHSFFRGVGNL